MIAFAFTRKDNRRAAYFSLLATALMFYVFGYMLEINATTEEAAMMALRIENVGIPLVTPFFLLTALGFFQPGSLRPWMLIACVVYGLAMFISVLTNDAHHLYYTWMKIEDNGSFYAMTLGKGPIYYVQQAVSITGSFSVYILLAVRYIRGSAKLRSQMNLFVIGSMLGFATNILYISGHVPLGIDPTPISLTVGLIFFVVVLSKHKLMDIVPVAFGLAVENMDDSTIVLDNAWGFIYCNQKAKALIPSLSTFLGAEEVLHAEGWPEALSPHSERDVAFSFSHPVTKQITQQQANVSQIHDKFGKLLGVSIIIRDITEITDMVKQLETLAITDHLTGVFNRRHFMTLVERQMGLAQRHDLPIGILMLDIDHFKNVNDTYSHIAGDHVLCSIAQAMERQLRVHDVFARYGGEEFIVLSAEKDESNLLLFAERLRKTIENELIIFEGNEIRITASFGAVMILPGQRFEAGMEAVDRALYEAKAGGRNRVALGKITCENTAAGKTV